MKNISKFIKKAAIQRQYNISRKHKQNHKRNYDIEVENRHVGEKGDEKNELDDYKIDVLEVRRNINYTERTESSTSDAYNEADDKIGKENIDINLAGNVHMEYEDGIDSTVNYDSHNDKGIDDQSLDSSFLYFTEPAQEQSNKASIFMGIFVAVGGFLYGYDTGLINSIIDMTYVKNRFTDNMGYFSARQLSIIVSFLSLGTFAGALMAPALADTIGRKPPVIISAAFVFLIGNSLQVAATGITLLTVGRVISGIAIGIISVVVPLYQGEASKKSLRGAIISTYQWAITWGLLVSSAVSQGTYSRNNASSYRIPLGLQFIWSCLLAGGMIFLPESPRYFVLKDKLDKAASSLSLLRGVPVQDSGLLEELVEIKATYDYEVSFGSTTFLDCFRSNKSRPKQILRMFTGMAINAFQQFSGINFIFYYGVNFFSRTGIKNSYRISFITYAVNVAFNVPGLFLVDYLGRRTLLIYGGIVMAISNFIIAIVGTTVNGIIADNVMVAFICVFIASFSCTWGSTVWVISAELYPLGVRSKCMAICASTNWLVNFICALITPYLVDISAHTAFVGPKIFFLWGSLNSIGIIVAYLTVFETKGLTLEEINELFEVCPTPMASTMWNSKMRSKRVSAEKERIRNYEIQMGRTFDPNQLANDNDNSTSEGISENNAMPRNNQLATIGDYRNLYSKTNDLEAFEEYCDLSNIGGDILTESKYNSNVEMKSFSTKTVFDSSQNNYFDLGNGLGLNAYDRGPPSLPSDSDECEPEEYGSSNDTAFYTSDSDTGGYQRVSSYVSQFVESTGSMSSNITAPTQTHSRTQK